ncbi:jg16495 [Pararge aegeria aegeria]|uniref:Jg16495 protein n=4 Tax=Pararge aegeria TaxID=116150 RepID=A0A8S4R0J2_9NEOP|nr:jg16495 [Pararge aegeria aegeria]
MIEFEFENSQSICRICFEIKSDVRPLFSKKEDRFIYEELVKYAHLNLHINDGGPATICGQCFEELNVFMAFLDKCKRANEIFLQHMQCQNDTRHSDRGQNLLHGASHSDRSNILLHSKSQIDSGTNLSHANHIDSSSNLPHCADERDTEDGSNKNENCGQDNLTHNLNNPMLKVAQSKPASHKCQICSKVFTRKFNYKQHL